MCGRYVITEEMYEEYARIVRDFDPLLYALPQEIVPSRTAPVIRCEGEDLIGRNMTFGFSGYEKGKMLFNARSETAAEKITFKDSLLKRRCVMPAASFFEWNPEKQKAEFFLPEKQIMYLAGFYRKEEDGNHFVILTRDANSSVRPVHERMPLILKPEDIRPWISDGALTQQYLGLFGPELKYQIDNEQISLF